LPDSSSELFAEIAVDAPLRTRERVLTYRVPEKLAGRVRLGSIVRVPIRGRRARGWVVGLDVSTEVEPSRLVDIATLSGKGPVFDAALLSALRELSRDLLSPLPDLLALLTPARLGRPIEPVEWERPEVLPGRCVLWQHGPAEDPSERYFEIIDRRLAEGLGAIVCVPEVKEGSRVVSGVVDRYPTEVAVVHSNQDPAERSKALWDIALQKKKVVVGGRGAVFAPAFPVGSIIIHEEHDPSFKEQRGPYYDARSVALARARAEGCEVILASSSPSVRSTAMLSGRLMLDAAPRETIRAHWPKVEVVPPERGPVPRRAVALVIETLRARQRVLLLLPRVRVTKMGPGPEQLVRFLNRVVPNARIGRADRGVLEAGSLAEVMDSDVIVATEAALTDIYHPQIAAGIALGVDALLTRPGGRAAEDAFATLWRLGTAVCRGGAKGRVVLETELGEHHVVQALTRGDAGYFNSREIELRKLAGSPPFVSMIRLQVAGEPDGKLMDALSALPGTAVLGPIEGGIGSELLLKVSRFEDVVEPLGNIVAMSPQRILAETDPIDW